MLQVDAIPQSAYSFVRDYKFPSIIEGDKISSLSVSSPGRILYSTSLQRLLK
mgnify:FL=1